MKFAGTCARGAGCLKRIEMGVTVAPQPRVAWETNRPVDILVASPKNNRRFNLPYITPPQRNRPIFYSIRATDRQRELNIGVIAKFDGAVNCILIQIDRKSTRLNS